MTTIATSTLLTIESSTKTSEKFIVVSSIMTIQTGSSKLAGVNETTSTASMSTLAISS
uniref:Uncharacterized protein n=1 Tax=Romanomermis culicivorax TaxID=13658 RepID=A0A915K187_ROMCU